MQQRVFSEYFFNLRNRLLSNSGFRRWAQKRFLTQWFAKRRSERLFRLCSGFIHSQVLLACVRLGLFDTLRDGPQAVETIISKTGLSAHRGVYLLRAAAALELLQRRPNGDFGIGNLGAVLIDNQSLLALVEHHALLYEDLLDPVALFNKPDIETRLSKLWPYAGSDAPGELTAEQVSAYTNLMATSQTMVAEQVLDAYSLARHKLLDLGGGAGAFVAAAARRWPHLRPALADLPAVAEIANNRLEQLGLADRIDVVPFDATKETLPSCYDVVSLIRIIHDHDDEQAMQMLTAARSALTDAGTLIIAEPMADAPGAGPLIDAYFNVYLLAMGSGRPRSFEEVAELLKRAGFHRVRRRATHVPLITSVIVATR